MKTLLILGAGASAPYGLPTGADLRDLLVLERSLHTRSTIEKYTPLFAGTIHDYDGWAKLLESGMDNAGFSLRQLGAFQNRFFLGRGPSIDHFLQENHDLLEIGKTAMANILLACERPWALDKDWYQVLLQLIAPNMKEFPRYELMVLTFNYDRSMELFFDTALEYQFHLSQHTAKLRRKKGMPIFHLYGSLGELDEVGYGERDKAAEAAKKLELMRYVRRAAIPKPVFSGYENVVFIGFSFASENLALLRNLEVKKRNVLITTKGLPETRIAEIRKRWPQLRDGSFFDGYTRDLLLHRDIFALAHRDNPAYCAP